MANKELNRRELIDVIEKRFNLNGSYSIYLQESDDIKKELDELTIDELKNLRKHILKLIKRKIEE